MEHNNINAVIRLGNEDYPERKRTAIVITDEGDNVYVGVKAIARVYERNDEGNISIHEEQWGEISALHKDAPIGCLFDSLKELFDKVPEIIDRTTATGDKA